MFSAHCVVCGWQRVVDGVAVAPPRLPGSRTFRTSKAPTGTGETTEFAAAHQISRANRRSRQRPPRKVGIVSHLRVKGFRVYHEP